MFAGISRHRGKPARDSGTHSIGREVDSPGAFSVLCVDDHVEILAFLSRLFRRRGWTVETAATVRTGVARARTGSFSALVIDLKLPDGSGLEIIRALRRAGIQTPAVVLTGHPNVDSAIEATKLGLKYLVKGQVNTRGILETVGELAHDLVGSSDRDLVRRASVELVWEMASDAAGAPDAKIKACTTFARLLTDPNLSFSSFVIGAKILRALLDPASSNARVIEFLRQQIVRLSELQPARVGDVIDLLVAHVEARVSRRPANDSIDFAKRAGVHIASVKTGLGKLGLSWPQFLRAALMRRALGDLAHGADYVSQTAFRLGYDHPSAFNRDFRLFTGAAPTRYREMTRS